MSYDTQVPPAAAPQVMRNGLGTAALILGIIGTLSGLIPLFFWLAGILGLIALILGLVGKGRVKRHEANNKGVAVTGAILGLAALILSVVGAVITFTAVKDAVDEIDKTIKETAPKDPTGASAGASGGAGDAGAGAAKDLADGDTSVYDDDLKVTVSDPKPYSPSEFAVGHTKGNKAYQVTVVIENGGKEKFDATLVTLTGRAGKNGVTAEQIFDEKVGTGFEGSILAGKKATVTVAFDAPKDAKNLTVEVNPGFDYNPSQWELKVG
ncbi:DUF4190 domain-containing protein [Streptomyces sp. NPDC096319]|uniref:DUF4190 domain-containing protein n=1 Tax=Streptomyces sp. NPDC096319 TaxID=3366084 RepID=UPI003810FE3F